jgi:hypothetical protein
MDEPKKAADVKRAVRKRFIFLITFIPTAFVVLFILWLPIMLWVCAVLVFSYIIKKILVHYKH